MNRLWPCCSSVNSEWVPSQSGLNQMHEHSRYIRVPTTFNVIEWRDLRIVHLEWNWALPEEEWSRQMFNPLHCSSNSAIPQIYNAPFSKEKALYLADPFSLEGTWEITRLLFCLWAGRSFSSRRYLLPIHSCPQSASIQLYPVLSLHKFQKIKLSSLLVHFQGIWCPNFIHRNCHGKTDKALTSEMTCIDHQLCPSTSQRSLYQFFYQPQLPQDVDSVILISQIKKLRLREIQLSAWGPTAQDLA